MISDVPNPEDFFKMGNSLLHSSWVSLVALLKEYEENLSFSSDDSFEQKYFEHSKPILMSAFTLVQQTVEFFLKGKIAEVSPYILIANDGRNWPKGADKNDISFQDFRTIDAQDLIKIHNTFSSNRLDNEFITWFNQMRVIRNKIIHSVSIKTSIKPEELAIAILTAHEYFFGEKNWINSLFDYHVKLPSNDLDIVSEEELEGYRYFEVHEELSLVIKSLPPRFVKQFFGFDPKAKSIVCNICESKFEKIYSYEDEHWKKHNIKTLIQQSKKLNYFCFVCNNKLEVLNASCIDCQEMKLDKNTGKCIWCN